MASSACPSPKCPCDACALVRRTLATFTPKDATVDRGCPYCGAGPGEFCHTPTGKPRSDHAAREYEIAEDD